MRPDGVVAWAGKDGLRKRAGGIAVARGIQVRYLLMLSPIRYVVVAGALPWT